MDERDSSFTKLSKSVLICFICVICVEVLIFQRSSCVYQRLISNASSGCGADDEALRRCWAGSKGIAGNERKRIAGRWPQQAYVLRVGHADEIDHISLFAGPAVMSIHPLKFNLVTLPD